MTWASNVIDLLEAAANNISSQFITHLTSFNGTACGNISMINDLTMPASGALGVSITDLGASAKIGVVRNNTLAYLNSGSSIDANTIAGFDMYVNIGDTINVQSNVSTNIMLDLYFRRT